MAAREGAPVTATNDRPESRRYLVVSGDGHAGPPLPGFAPYFDPEHRDAFDRYWRARPSAPLAEAAAGGDLDALAGFLDGFMRATGATPEPRAPSRSAPSKATLGLFDSAIRDRFLDAEGIVAEVLYGDGFVENQPPFSDIMESRGQIFGGKPWPFELQLAGARAYNRWLADFCSSAPARRLGVIQLPAAHDIAALVTETERAHDAGLRGGILVPALEPGLPGYHDPHYDPLWAVAAERGLPVSVHGGNARSPDGPDAYGDEEPLASFFHFTESTFFDRRPLWFFIWGGVFDRHPELKLVFAEALSHWVPQELMRLDEMIDMWNAKALRERIERRPSDYWRSNCAITATFISRGEAEMRHAIGIENLLWGSDFPHPEGTWPITETCQRHALHDIPDAETARILGENAVDFYRLDRGVLQAMADRIGPAPSAIAKEPDALPRDYLGMGLR